MSPEEQLVQAQPTWMTQVPVGNPVVRSGDYPMAPLMERQPSILTTGESFDLGGGQNDFGGSILLAIVPVDGIPYYATIPGQLGAQVTT